MIPMIIFIIVFTIAIILLCIKTYYNNKVKILGTLFKRNEIQAFIIPVFARTRDGMRFKIGIKLIENFMEKNGFTNYSISKVTLSYRIRIRAPGDFIDGKFKIVPLNYFGIRVITGRPLLKVK